MKILLVLLVAALTGCAQTGFVVDRAAEVNDKAIDSAVFGICNGVSVGSVRRKFDTREKAEIWRELCSVSNGWSPE